MKVSSETPTPMEVSIPLLVLLSALIGGAVLVFLLTIS